MNLRIYIYIYIYMYTVYIELGKKYIGRRQGELPSPRKHRLIDAGKNDLELFQQYVAPSGGLLLLGDMWDDVPRSNLKFWLGYPVYTGH